MAISIGPEDYLPSEESNAPTRSEVQEAFIRRSASDYQDRHNNSVEVGNSGNAAKEMELLQLQNQLSLSTHPLETEALQARVLALATELTTGSAAPAAPAPRPDYDTDAKDEVIANFGEEELNSTLSWAKDVFSDETITEVNKSLHPKAGKDKGIQTFENLRQLKSLPQEAFSQKAETFSASDAEQLVSRYGEQGEQLVTLNAALAAGMTTPAKVMSMAMSDPALRQVALQAAREGLITLTV